MLRRVSFLKIYFSSQSASPLPHSVRTCYPLQVVYQLLLKKFRSTEKLEPNKTIFQVPCSSQNRRWKWQQKRREEAFSFSVWIHYTCRCFRLKFADIPHAVPQKNIFASLCIRLLQDLPLWQIHRAGCASVALDLLPISVQTENGTFQYSSGKQVKITGMRGSIHALREKLVEAIRCLWDYWLSMQRQETKGL